MRIEDGDSVSEPVFPLANRNQHLLPTAASPVAGARTNSARTELTLAALWNIIWEWRWLLLSAIAVGLAGAVIVTLLMTPMYLASSVVEINPPTVEIVDEAKAGASSGSDQAYIGTQIGLLKGRAIAERVVQDLNLASTTGSGGTRAEKQHALAGKLIGNVDIQLVPASRLITISYESESAESAAQIANGYADAYIASNLERRYQSSAYAREFLQRKIIGVRKDLENSERRVVEYAQKEGIIQTGNSTEGDASSLPGASLVALNNALAEATTRRITAEEAYREGARMSTSAEVSERTAALRAQRSTLQAQYQQKRSVLRPDYPEMVSLQAQIDELSASIDQEAGNVRGGRNATLRAEYQGALAAEAQLRNQVSSLRGQVLNLRGRSIQYTILQREVDTNRALYDALLQRYKEIGVAGGIGSSNALIAERAPVPSGPFRPNLLLNLLVGLGLGIVSGMGLALILEFVNDTIKTPDDVRNDLRLPFLGGIPDSKSKSPVDDLRDTASNVSEAYFSVAASLQITSGIGVPKTLLVTSTRPAEGKSTSIWALARNFTRLNLSVLLIDADMRKPAFVVDSEKDRGLSFLLANHESVQSHVLRTETEGLWLLPCGSIPPNPAELLASLRFKALLAEARAEYDVVLVDGPPIIGLADAPILAQLCEGTVMIVEAGKTRTRAAIEALDRLRSTSVNVLGAVLTRYKQPAGYGYGYGYEQYAYKPIEGRDRKIRLVVSRDKPSEQ